MNVNGTAVADAYVLEPELIEDERGFYARSVDLRALAERGLVSEIAECGIAYNHSLRTLRGLHYQTEPHAQAKLVRCTRGKVYDVAVDLRPESVTHLRWAAVTLSAENRRVFYVPPGCAHGYLTLEADSEVLYEISHPYAPEANAGIRWDDPVFGIEWPATPLVIAPRDASYPDFAPVGV